MKGRKFKKGPLTIIWQRGKTMNTCKKSKKHLCWYTWCDFKWSLCIQHFLPPPKHHNFVTSNEVSQAQHFNTPEGLIKIALCNLCDLPDQNRYLRIGQFLQLSFWWRTHLWVSLHTAGCNMIKWCKAALKLSTIYHIFKRPKPMQ